MNYVATASAELPDPRERPTLPIWPDTCRILGLSRNAGYAAAARGEIPVLRIGNRLLVPTAKLAALLGQADPGRPAA